MLIPEIILFNTVTVFQQILVQDYAVASDKTKTILNDLFGVDDDDNPLQLQKFVYFDQAVALFTRTQESPRQFTVNIGYNMERAFLPTVHILLPQESTGRYNAIGFNAGDETTQFYPDDTPQYEVDVRARSYRASFDLMITSDNSSEVLLIYFMIKNMLLYTGDTFELLGLHNYEMTGQDIQLEPGFAPPNVFHRSIRLTFDYLSEVKIRNVANFASQLNFMICSSFAADNTPKPTGPQNYVSNNYQISLTNTINTGSLGTIKIINKATKAVAVTYTVSPTGTDSGVQQTASLQPATYLVEINLNDFQGKLTVTVNDGVNHQYDSSGTTLMGSFAKTIDISSVQSNGIYITLAFN